LAVNIFVPIVIEFVAVAGPHVLACAIKQFISVPQSFEGVVAVAIGCDWLAFVEVETEVNGVAAVVSTTEGFVTGVFLKVEAYAIPPITITPTNMDIMTFLFMSKVYQKNLFSKFLVLATIR